MFRDRVRGHAGAMRWEDYLIAVFDDLERQAEGLSLAQRRADAAALAVAEYAEVDLAARLHAATGAEVRMILVDGVNVRGSLTRAGRGWVLVGDVGDAGASVIVLTAQLVCATGLPAAAVAEPARSRAAGLGVGSALRALVDDRRLCVLRCVGGRQVEGEVVRVGGDFVEVRSAGTQCLIPIDRLSTVQEAW